MNKIEEMKRLVEILNTASDAYYNGKETLMTDAEFDLKLKHLQDLEKELNLVLSNSPTVNVGAPVLDTLEKVKHEYKPMLSLAKCHSAEEVVKFANGHDLIAMVKLDGLSCRLTYLDGTLIKAETRGDGETGNLITEHARQFKNIPLTIDKKGTYVIDGEAIITNDDFIAINDALPKGTEKFKNSRNLASGTLALLDTSIVKDRKISFIGWDVIVGSDEVTIQDKLNEAADLGFECTPWVCVYTKNLFADYIEGINKVMFDTSEELFYPNDGVVWKVFDVAYGERLGRTEHHFNLGIAYKAAQEEYETTLKDVIYTMGKTGSLTPVAIFEPVEIDGTSVEKASLHNLSVVKDLYNDSEWYEGLKVFVYKANQIIPQISRVEGNSDDYYSNRLLLTPKTCPICGAATEIRKDNDTEVLYCTNKDCKGLMLGKFNAFVSKHAMDIDGLSEATLELLLNKGYISTFKDLYHLSEYKAELSSLPGFGAKSVAKLLAAIENSRHTDLARFLTALSIPNVGRSTAKDIAKYCHGSIDELIFILNNTILELMTIDGIGRTVLDSLDSWWEENAEMVHELLEELNLAVPEEKKDNVNSKSLNGASFCITGKLEHFANRDAMVESIVAHGGQYLSGVSSKLNYLVNNDKTSTSGKNKKALDLGIKIISEQDYLQMIGE